MMQEVVGSSQKTLNMTGNRLELLYFYGKKHCGRHGKWGLDGKTRDNTLSRIIILMQTADYVVL